MLKKIGRFIAVFLLILFFIKVLILFCQFAIFESITLDEALARLILFVVPTEVTIVETLASYPIAILLALLFYRKYVR